MKGKAWVISVDMGYGHQRAAYPLKDIAFERIITANNDKIISEKERAIWYNSKVLYEFVSKLKQVPVLGRIIFTVYDKLQEISPFYPFRDLSKPNFAVLYTKDKIKDGLCRSLIDYTKKENIPFIATHFIPVLAAHYSGLKKIYCVVTDTDINRVWVPDKPKNSNIIYLAPCKHVVMRLREYGVNEKNIILTGFPLPKENIGGLNKNILKNDLAERILNLDPKRIYISKYHDTLKKYLGRDFKKNKKSNHPLTITYMVGGAGAQMDIGIDVVKSLKERILKKELKINLVAGTRLEVASYYNRELVKIGLKERIGSYVKIIFALDKKSYFSAVNQALRTTDVLWTKPSELAFYTALGLPIIIAPPVGAQERFNLEWLQHTGSGFVQQEPKYTKDWLFYWLEDGRLAEAALNGYLDAPCMGTYEIEKVVLKK